jgi:hypothetical protein
MYVVLKISKTQYDKILAEWKEEHASYYEKNVTTVKVIDGRCMTTMYCGIMVYDNGADWLRSSGAIASLYDAPLHFAWKGRRHSLHTCPGINVSELKDCGVVDYKTSRPDLKWWETAT